LYEDCVTGDAADLVIHMGDHAYAQGDDDERRGDMYMTAFSKTIANVPWMPIIGNHEFYAGAKLKRYLDQTWEEWGPIPGGNGPRSGSNSSNSSGSPAYTASTPLHSVKGTSFEAHADDITKDTVTTATSPLGALLSAGNHHGLGLTGSVPSKSSRYFSVDFGLLHLVSIDLNLYYGTDDCGESCIKAQKEWLAADLKAANANRKNVPWVVVMAHYPFYCTGCYADQLSSRYYESNDAEFFGNANRTAAARLMEASIADLKAAGASQAAIEIEANSWTKQVKASSDAAIKDMIPFLNEYYVDLYLAGHWHYYESLWPAEDGTTGTGGQPLAKTLVNPKKTIHVTTGNGGPPGKDNFKEDCPGPDCGSIPATRFQSNEFGYGRLVVPNATHLTYMQIQNKDGKVSDEWTLVKDTHGPF
jgi:hypothetical protein